MYVSDSLFYLQHIFTDKDDENHGAMFGKKLREILEDFEKENDSKNEQNVENEPEKFIDYMVKKSEKLCGK